MLQLLSDSYKSTRMGIISYSIIRSKTKKGILLCNCLLKTQKRLPDIRIQR
ncbi:hypothetical protein Hdeb2414_s0007g00262501 [Helianthus debilis subsp. tardiflorus]